ncbi:DinB family protein [Kribbella swartbergensis]
MGFTVAGMSETPWEPPVAGDEVAHLVGMLERLRTTFRWKADELDADGLQTRIGASSLTLGGLLKHLAANEDYLFRVKFRGQTIGEPWESNGWNGDNDWELTSAADDSPEELYALWDGAVERSRACLAEAIADGGLDQPSAVSWPDGRHASLRRLVCDLIEEYGRHTGHADLLREAVDGRVGEDPPPGWHPVGAKA